jgi:hypothetical protein
MLKWLLNLFSANEIKTHHSEPEYKWLYLSGTKDSAPNLTEIEVKQLHQEKWDRS